MVSIITVNFNQPELTFALLDSIRRQEYRDVEVIVVDNASMDDPSAAFQTRYPEALFIRSEKNLGFAGGNNLALSHATGDILFFVNNDAEITEGCIAQLVQFLEKTPEAGIVSPLICYHRLTVDGLRPTDYGGRPTVYGLRFTAYGGRSTVDGLRPTGDGLDQMDHPSFSVSRQPSTVGRKPSAVGRRPSAVIQYAGMPRVNPFTARSNMDGNGVENRGQYASPFPTGYAHGAAMMLPRRVLESVGPMREDYFLYYEEVDWCERIHQAGYTVWVEPRALVWHKESMTMRTLGTAKTWYLNRNRILFMRRHYGGWSFAVFMLFLTFVTIPKHLIAYGFKGDWANMRAFLKGIKAGIMNNSASLTQIS